ncbi:hypothetical protein ACN27G_21380 [Plantactinospora sp. WMMB334]|uniref:hypothetical protein n=1 Tax=Plantactinospora sp. WMMB334 TaxID=3404119 RepID=UPI003B959F3A
MAAAVAAGAAVADRPPPRWRRVGGRSGRRSGIHLSDVVAAVNDLADRHLVERSPDPTDR